MMIRNLPRGVLSKRSVVIALLLLVSRAVPTAAQTLEGEIFFDHLTTEEGLSENYVTGILQDHRGFMWFATQDGLNRYDGYAFKTYRHAPGVPTSLSDSYVYSIYEDSLGSLWVGTLRGLNRFDWKTGGFSRFLHDPADPFSLSHDRVNVIYEDRSGILWIGTHRGGLNRLERERGRFHRYVNDPTQPNSLNSSEVWAIHEDRSGVLWVGTDRGGLNRFDRATETWTSYLPDLDRPNSLSNNEIRAIYEGRGGILWIGTRGGGLNRFDPAAESFGRWTDAAYVYSILEDTSGTFWFGTRNGGLYQLDRETGDFKKWMYEPGNSGSLSHNYARVIYEDRSGLIWVGTKGGGINKLRRPAAALTHYLYGIEAPRSLGDERVLSLLEDFSGMLWIGTEGGGLYQFDRGGGGFVHYQPDTETSRGLADGNIYAICEDRSGRLWFIDGRSLYRFDRQTERFVAHRIFGLEDRDQFGHALKIFALHADQQGFLWIGTSLGIVQFDPDRGEVARHVTDPKHHEISKLSLVRSLVEDSDGVFWLGTYDGLKRFDRERARWTYYNSDLANPRSLSGNIVWSMYEDPLGRLWVGTGSGLSRFDKTSKDFTRFTEDDGLPSNLIYSIVGDSKSLWIATSNGLVRFDLETEKFKAYGEDHGFHAGPFSRNAAFKSREGEMFFAGERGIVAFQPGQVKMNLRPSPVVLTGFRKFNKKVDLGRPLSEASEIELSHKDNFVSFEFAVLDYHFPEKNRYAHRLVGFDQDWVENGTGRTATYTNLEPKDYVLRVKGASRDGAWNEEGLSLKIRVIPPFWQTWWFRLAGFLALFGLVWAVYGMRTRAARRRQKELERNNLLLEQLVEERTGELRASQAELLANERLITLGQLTATVSHELRNPLGAMRPSLYTLRKRIGAADPKLLTALERVERGVKRCDNIVDELLDFTRTARAERLPVTIDSWLGELLDEQSVPDGLTVRRQLALPGLTVPVDAESFRRAVVNVYENACPAMASENEPARAREGSILTVTTRRAGEGLEIEVADTGSGIPKEVLPRIFEPLYSTKMFGVGLGLPIVQRVLEDHGGDAVVETVEGQGSRVVFRLPTHIP